MSDLEKRIEDALVFLATLKGFAFDEYTDGSFDYDFQCGNELDKYLYGRGKTRLLAVEDTMRKLNTELLKGE
jgi:hypothetical protein